jgi:hypothetical protein
MVRDPWLSTKGRTMGIGKAVSCSHGPSSIVWSENGPCCRIIAYFVGGKRGEDLVHYNMSHTLSIWENYLVVFVCFGICYGIYISCNLSWNLSCWKNHETWFIIRHVGLHVEFSSMKSSLDLYAFTFMCEVNLDGLCPFNQWELLDYNGHMPSVMCVKWP